MSPNQWLDLKQRNPKIESPGVLDLEYVVKADVVPTLVGNLMHKTLLLDFDQPFSVLSTLDGFKEQVVSIGNHHLPPASWGDIDEAGLPGLHVRTCRALNRSAHSCSLLFTGVDVDYLSVQRQQYQQTQIYALVTAGGKENAAHMVEDRGEYYEPGTINIILLSNRTFTHRAMTQALIVATEAKTAALSDLDIRSSYSPLENAATGTGTDGALVVQGTGVPIEYAGGHTKIGELIAKAVHSGVLAAIAKWDGLTSKRNILLRLQERHISLSDLHSDQLIPQNKFDMALQKLLRQPRYASFIATAMTLNDSYKAGLITDLGAFDTWCQLLMDEIAGEKTVLPIEQSGSATPLLKALNGLASALSKSLKNAP